MHTTGLQKADTARQAAEAAQRLQERDGEVAELRLQLELLRSRAGDQAPAGQDKAPLDGAQVRTYLLG